MEDGYDAYQAVEELTAAEYVDGDLETIIEQLDRVNNWQGAQFFATCVLIGVVVGCVIAKIIGGIWG